MNRLETWSWSATFSPDGKKLAVGEYSGVGLWDVATGNRSAGLEGQGEKVTALAFAPDGKSLVGGDHGGNIRFWDVSREPGRPRFEWQQQLATCAALSPDGKLLAAGGIDGTVRLREVATGKELHRLPGYKARTSALHFSPDGKLLAGQVGSKVCLWDTRSGKPYPQFRPPDSEEVEAIAFSCDSKVLAVQRTQGSNGRSVLILWDLEAGQERCRHPEVSPSNGVILSFTPDGKTLAVGDMAVGQSQESLVRLLDAVTGKELRRFTGCQRRPHTLAFSPDGRLLFVGSEPIDWSDRKVGSPLCVWDVRTGQQHPRFRDRCRSLDTLALSPDGRVLATAEKGAITLWEVVTGNEIRRLAGHPEKVKTLSFTANGRVLFSVGEDGVAMLWDMTGRGQTDPARPRSLSHKDQETAWADLASSDAGRADRALWSLVDAPEQALSLLRHHLRPASAVETTRLARLLADLDSDSFTDRTRATEELADLGKQVESALHEGLTKQPPPEARRRMEGLLMRVQDPVLTTGRLRRLRALQVLERIGTTEARQLLETLEQGAPEAWLTQEAKLSLQRLAKRPTLP